MNLRNDLVFAKTVMVECVVAPGTDGYQFVLMPNLSHFWIQTWYFPARIITVGKATKTDVSWFAICYVPVNEKQTEHDDIISSYSITVSRENVRERRYAWKLLLQLAAIFKTANRRCRHSALDAHLPWFSWAFIIATLFSVSCNISISCTWMSYVAIFFFTDLFFPLFVVFVKHSAYLSELPRQINTETSCLVEMRHLMQYKLFLMRTLESGWSRRHDPPLRD